MNIPELLTRGIPATAFASRRTGEFVSMHRPLSAYVSAFRAAGFAIDAPCEFGAKAIPWLMVMRLNRLDTRPS
jgi:hypothetical protein